MKIVEQSPAIATEKRTDAVYKLARDLHLHAAMQH